MKFLQILENALAVAFWALLIFGFDIPYIAVLTLCAAVLHECGHLIALLLFSRKGVGRLRGDISGFRIFAETMSYKEELHIALGGPLINLTLFSALYFLPFGSYLREFALLNLLTAASNLMPIEGYDGYRIISAFFGIATPDGARYERGLQSVSFFTTVVMTFLSLYLLLKLGEGYWIFAVFFTITLSQLVKRQKAQNARKNEFL